MTPMTRALLSPLLYADFAKWILFILPLRGGELVLQHNAQASAMTTPMRYMVFLDGLPIDLLASQSSQKQRRTFQRAFRKWALLQSLVK